MHYVRDRINPAPSEVDARGSGPVDVEPGIGVGWMCLSRISLAGGKFNHLLARQGAAALKGEGKIG